MTHAADRAGAAPFEEEHSLSLEARTMRIILLASPGAPGRVWGATIAAHFDIAHLAMRELLRDQIVRGTDLGRAARERLVRGEAVPDRIALELFRRELAGVRAGGQYLVEGLPCTLDQAREGYKIALDLGLTADVALLPKAGHDGVSGPLVAWYRRRGILLSAEALGTAREAWLGIVAALEAMRPLLEHVPEHLRRPVELSGAGGLAADRPGSAGCRPIPEVRLCGS
ncbi:MAG TPA: nucleoside monophosphate kinase [Dactylosporangium sp.]|nr:nucleoside monophosphate kinase [Dactylosporangium sp.]